MDRTPPLPTEHKRALDQLLTPGERVLWAGQPRASSMWAGFGIYLFAVPWTAFALFWESMALIPFLSANETTPAVMKYGFGIVFPLFGLPFVAVGVWMMAAPVRAMARARRTIHALTSRRIVTMTVGRGTVVKSAFVDRIGPVERRSGSDGWGSVRIQTHSRLDSDGDRVTEQLEWIGIPNAAHVERLIAEAQLPR